MCRVGMVWYQCSVSANALTRFRLSKSVHATDEDMNALKYCHSLARRLPPFKPCPHRSQMAYGGDQHDRPYRCQLKEDFCQFNNSAVFNWQIFKALPPPQGGGHHGREVFIVKGSHPRCYNIYIILYKWPRHFVFLFFTFQIFCKYSAIT